MEQHRTRSHRSKSRTKKQTKFERFLSSPLFIILGIISILAGLYSMIAMGDGHNGLHETTMAFFAPQAVGPIVEITGSGSEILILYFLPAILALIGSMAYIRKNISIAYRLSIIVTLYLIVIQTITNFRGNFLGGPYYGHIFYAALYLFLPVILIFLTSILHRKSSLLILAGLYFYISVIFYTQYYGTPYNYLFPFVLIFSAGIYWVGLKIKKPAINLTNFLCAISYFSLFWLRNFIIHSKTDLLVQFFVLNTLIYLLYYLIEIFASHPKENPLPKWMQLLISWANLSVFLGTMAYVLFKYFAFGYLPVLVILLLLFNILGLYLIKRYNSPVWQLPHYFAIIGLASLVLPLLLRQNMILLFTAMLSVLMLAYYKKLKEISAMWISLIAMSGMVLFDIASWIRIYLPAIFADTLPANELTIHGLVSGLAVIGALLATRYLLKDYDLPLPKKMFGKRKHYRLVRTFLLVTLFLTLGWLGFITVGQLTATRNFLLVGWFIAGALFFIAMINVYAGHQSVFKKPVLYAAFGFAFLYPVMVHWSMADYRIGMIHSSDISWNVLLIHYLALGLLLQLGRLVVKRIHRHNVKNTPLREGLSLVTILFLIFILCTEYDNLSVILSAFQNNALSQTTTGPDLLTANKYLPYSIIIWIVTVGVFFRAVMRRQRFLRDVSIMVFAAVMIKIFAFDLGVLSQGAKSAVFLILGIFLLLFAIVYPRVLKGLPFVPELRRKQEMKE